MLILLKCRQIQIRQKDPEMYLSKNEFSQLNNLVSLKVNRSKINLGALTVIL
jgi:hypothetical protein